MSNQKVKYEKTQKGTLGYRIWELRKKYNLTLEFVARETGFTRQTISDYEWNKSHTNTEFVKNFVNLLKEKFHIDLAPEYLMYKEMNIKSKGNVPIAKALNLSEAAIDTLLEVKRNGHTKALSKLLETSNFPKLLATIELVLRDKKIAIALQDESSEKANDAINYLNWLLNNEITFCVTEMSFKLFATFNKNYYEGQQKILQPKRDRLVEKLDNLDDNT